MQAAVKVNETETSAVLNDSGLQVNLAVGSDAQKNISAYVRLEILDTNDNILSRSETVEKIRRGQETLQISLKNVGTDAKKMLWYRLRYEINAGGNRTYGIVSLSEILNELFELRVSASEHIYAGMRFPVRVRAFHPTKNTPISNVKISAELKIDVETGEDNDENELKIAATGETDADGFAVLEFEIPENAKFSGNDSGDIEVKGVKNGMTSVAKDDLETLGSKISVYFLTDKPLYQPNQKIYIRALALRSGGAEASTTVAAEKELEFSIWDEDETVLYRQTLATSRFGIAAIEWQIPENAKLGTYRIDVKTDEELAQDRTHFKVSRYDLPNFVVQTKADKDFYLPEEKTAEVTVDALYLFGKPVASGKVKVVQESNREWNYSEQKWDIQEESVYEGETATEGKYVAKIDLSKAHAELKEDKDKQFKDLNFTAYYTDFSTNKTEQKRFDVRVSREPIHIYLAGKKGDDHNPKVPFNFYVSTYTADGKPVACDVKIKGKYEDEKEEKPLASFKTNSLGAHKIEFSAPKREDDAYFDDLELNISARDADGKIGTRKEEIGIDEDEKQIVLRTDKAIYRKGEPVKIEIISSEAEENVFIDVSKNLSSIESRRVRLKNGRAELKIPYNRNFKNNLTVSAYFDDDGDAVQDARAIVFPTPKNLRVSATSTKEVFRPNEEATVNFAVSSPDKTQAETALGVVILDKAVEERAKTDANFGGVDGIFQDFGALAGNSWSEIDMKKDIPAELQLFAEMRFFDSYYNANFFDSNYTKRPEYIFSETVKKQLEPVQAALGKRYSEDFEHPLDDASLRKILSREKIDFDALRDPWGNSYKAGFSVNKNYDIVTFNSAGANKIFGDDDDFTGQQSSFEYFTPVGIKLNQAVGEYFQKTGKFVRDNETLRSVLAAKDINLDALKDRWGESYRAEFGTSGRYYSIVFRSGNADKKFTGNNYDDFVVWTYQMDYFAATESKIETILGKFIIDKQTFPKDETEFKQILREGGVDFDALRDGWNQPFYLQYEIQSQFGDRVFIENVGKQGEKASETIRITPVTRKIAVVRLRSLGENGVKNDDSWEDTVFSNFAGIISEQARDDAKSKVVVPTTIFINGKSAIYGVVTDPNKAVVPNASVILTNNLTQASFETKTNDEGVYLQTNLAAGKYSVKVSAPGFNTSVVDEITVGSEKLVEINLALEVGASVTTVTVTAASEITIDQSSSKIETTITRQIIQDLPSGTQFVSLLKIAPSVRPEALSGGFQVDGASGSENTFVADGQKFKAITKSGTLNEENDLPANQRKSTPRLREYFPETLLWLPEIITDANGKAEIKFRLADNITTWKIYAIASDAKGKIGITEKEIKAFQPFFVDLEPPKFLTTGDEIFLPVQVRNYTKQKQRVTVEMTKADWFNFLDAGNKQVEVNSNASQNAVFGFRADKAIEEGKQKVTAIADTDSDAIEKPVTVRPNGQEIVKTESKLFYNSAAFNVNFPANALPETQEAELKIYPNLFSHVTESVEGLLHRPYGCGEQTISSTYPNLMILKFAGSDKKENGSIPKIAPQVQNQAKKYLLRGYERLLGYQTADGGFSYWGVKDTPDISLTAYAIRFLADARGFIEVDEKVIANAQNWLLRQQRADGSWTRTYYSETSEDVKRTKMITTYIARSLAMTEKDKKTPVVQTALQKAFIYLKAKNAEIGEPYALALFGLAALDSGDIPTAREIATRLEKLAITEGETRYWNLETNTPFYGWGTAGRIETTALVVQLLIREAQTNQLENVSRENLISRGTLFLLKYKDRFGVWYSTQTTINVLDAFLAALPAETENAPSQNIQISLNGENLQGISILPNQITPVIVKLSDKLNPAANRVEIKSSSSAVLMAQTVSTHYIDWQDADISNQTRGLRLDYKCDKTDAKIMEEINCAVETERTGFRGYGMLLAEIGLPPGADVSRESLEKALKDDWSLSRYEVLPDRIVLYMWSKPGGTKINFKFRPRYGINAQTPASFVYDYYNEEAKATLAPMKFSVK
ncbi:MAG: alpha-2-macroglobulin family protein [Pyrinomonadaceae bacterium]